MIVNGKLVGLIIRWCGVRLPGGPPKIEKPLFAVAFFTCLRWAAAGFMFHLARCQGVVETGSNPRSGDG